ncbi:MAG: hypothetical protein NXI13_16450 [Proteobacteria bacterium]|nr:hypothetical protein [Pseudomonadota bacterium]
MELYYSPQHVVVDATRTPMAGAKLNFYAAGTTTREDTYSDSALSTAHTNPVVADSEGRFPAIYFGTANDYKAVLTTSSDVVVYTQDNISNSQITSAKLASSSVTTAKVANDAITLAKMAHGTQGGIFYYGASGVPTQLAVGSAGQVLTSGGAGADVLWDSTPYPAAYKSGYTLSLAADVDHDITVTAGYARDSTNTANIDGSAMTKQIDATWDAGDNAGGMFTGTVAVDTTYYFFAILKDSDSSVDYGFDTSSTAANIPSGYTKYVLLDTLLTDGSSNLINSMNSVFKSPLFFTAANAISSDYPHGLGVAPDDITLVGIRKTASGKYAIGQRVVLGNANSGTNFGFQFGADATNVWVSIGTAGVLVQNDPAATRTWTTTNNTDWDYQLIAKP